MTSHEIRNPLSAVLHCADEISSSISDCMLLEQVEPVSSCRERRMVILHNALDAAQTIEHCVQHQKRIVDDVLTMSKLNSDLVTISPIVVQPAKVIQDALRLFRSEIKAADICLTFEEDSSLQELNIDWLLFDPSRILQVFVNLTTNAIKFTREREKRLINVRLAASLRRPSECNDGIDYFPPQANPLALPRPSSTDAETVYMSLAVQDTGCGLSTIDTTRLFSRFSQGSPKTYIQYGGSGLGLFISRQLVEIQGGGIGMTSTSGVGSTFAFFVKTERAAPPDGNPPLAKLPMDIHLEHMLKSRRRSVRSTRDVLLEPPSSRASASLPPDTTDSGKSDNATSENLNVLIVEDNLVNQKVIRRQLINRGYTVTVANQGREALEKLAETSSWNSTDQSKQGRRFDVILMDLEMPIMDGMECVSRIRALEAQGLLRHYIPVIAVTANVRSEQLSAAKKAGMVSNLLLALTQAPLLL